MLREIGDVGFGHRAIATTRILMIVVRDTGPMLMYAHDRGIDHRRRLIVTSGKHTMDWNRLVRWRRAGVWERGPKAAGRSRQGAPERRTQKDAIEHATIIYTPNATRFVWQHRFDRGPFAIAELVAHDFEAPVSELPQSVINLRWASLRR